MKKRVLITSSHFDVECQDALKLFEEHGIEVVPSGTKLPYLTVEELVKLVPDVDGCISGIDNWCAEVFEASDRLKAVAKFGVGCDNFDQKAAAEHGVYVLNAPGGNANAVAELTVGFILAGLRNVDYLHNALKEGEWKRAMGYELMGKTVGLFGFGDIARRVAKKLSGMDVTIIACDKYPNEEKAKELGVTFVSADELLARSDVVSLHVPNLPENENIMNAEAFAKMKQDAFFVNTARGVLVDEDALYQALKSGHLFGAALDVFKKEPVDPSNPLLSLPNVIATPHTASETHESYRDVGLMTAQGIIDVLEGREPKHWVNKKYF